MALFTEGSRVKTPASDDLLEALAAESHGFRPIRGHGIDIRHDQRAVGFGYHCLGRVEREGASIWSARNVLRKFIPITELRFAHVLQLHLHSVRGRRLWQRRYCS
jgi:hypothetical protein